MFYLFVLVPIIFGPTVKYSAVPVLAQTDQPMVLQMPALQIQIATWVLEFHPTQSCDMEVNLDASLGTAVS